MTTYLQNHKTIVGVLIPGINKTMSMYFEKKVIAAAHSLHELVNLMLDSTEYSVEGVPTEMFSTIYVGALYGVYLDLRSEILQVFAPLTYIRQLKQQHWSTN